MIAGQSDMSVEGRDIIVVQAKASRLGMYLMGQALFSAQLMQLFSPRSVESVALVLRDDEVLRPMFEQYAGMRVVVCPVAFENDMQLLSAERVTSVSRRRPPSGRA